MQPGRAGAAGGTNNAGPTAGSVMTTLLEELDLLQTLGLGVLEIMLEVLVLLDLLVVMVLTEMLVVIIHLDMVEHQQDRHQVLALVV